MLNFWKNDNLKSLFDNLFKGFKADRLKGGEVIDKAREKRSNFRIGSDIRDPLPFNSSGSRDVRE
ncbi:MAG: hypothetical protein COX90_01610 [Candidatus Nealsonbacteria bacterium CG_4_10_14_0_2_um_filter_38_17]|uniref:Uncharacterized protein n=2 Tax=Candidatus Nealsoniibacteriota TaxID=1817911 RepID=A0A2M7UYG5_9BACT|nr:MAG: hypothetical protein COX36_03460 [Candidatus Nealsonbacteria bacterium CG23_combo_of_CG06-09_8_20_14_all_38_19]PIZ89000.1 MAG: hypothetical protein COX90_01610 [Candidatus Nealsonbacteria bacterium CG_4_10_14_0_2_um_filter_38_17]